MNGHSAGHAELPRTAYLNNTLRRARSAAEQRSHRYVTLEHFLLALLDDPGAVTLLQAAGADIAVIRGTITSTVNTRMAALVDPSGRPPGFSYKFDQLFLVASADAMSAGRSEVDGAFALIAVAKDPESNASAILGANGFHWQIALDALTAAPLARYTPPEAAPLPPAAPPKTRIETDPRLEPQLSSPAGRAGGPTSPSHLGSQGPAPNSGESLMEDMLASVRNILDAEERKERGFPPMSPPAPAPSPHAGPPRLQPQSRAESSLDREAMRAPWELRTQSPYPGPVPRGEPIAAAPALAYPERRPPGPAGFSEPPAAGFSHGPPPAPAPRAKSKRRDAAGASRSRGEPSSPVAKLLESVPRKARIARAGIVQIRLNKEEAAQVFSQLPSRGQSQQSEEAEAHAARAVTIRMSAPEGGFFIETLTPETQWIFDRPSFLAEEAFGTWRWTMIPNESGSHSLSVSISARDIDGNGLVAERQAEHSIKVRIHGNLMRGFGGFVRTVLLLAAGSGLTVGAWAVLKMMGKLPR